MKGGAFLIKLTKANKIKMVTFTFPLFKGQDSAAFRLWEVREGQILLISTEFHPRNRMLVMDLKGSVINALDMP